MAEQRLQLRERDDSQRKCPWCFELIEGLSRELTWTCPRDGIICHRECAAQFRKCPQCLTPIESSTGKGNLVRKIWSRESRLYDEFEVVSNVDAIRALESTATLRELKGRVRALRPGVLPRFLLIYSVPLVSFALCHHFLRLTILEPSAYFFSALFLVPISIYLARKLNGLAESKQRDELRAAEASGAAIERPGQGGYADDRAALRIYLDYEDAAQALQRWVESPVEERLFLEGHRLINRVIELKWEIERRYTTTPGPASPADQSTASKSEAPVSERSQAQAAESDAG